MQRLGWAKIPAVVKDVDDRTLLTLALIENLQRDDLSPIDEAAGYQRLIEEFKLPQAEIARLVGTESLDGREPAPPAQAAGRGEGAGAGAEAFRGSCAGAARPRRIRRRSIALAREAVRAGWSVRDLEARVRGRVPGRRHGRRARPARRRPAREIASADVRRVEDALRKRLGTDVRVTARRRGRGSSPSATTPTTIWPACSS